MSCHCIGELINPKCPEHGSMDRMRKRLDAATVEIGECREALKYIHWLMGDEGVPAGIRRDVCNRCDKLLPDSECPETTKDSDDLRQPSPLKTVDSFTSDSVTGKDKKPEGWTHCPCCGVDVVGQRQRGLITSFFKDFVTEKDNG